MSRVFSVLLIVPVFFILVIFISANLILRADFNEFEEYRLEVVNNYCTDAAVGEMLLSDDLDQDYADTKKVMVNPNVARDTYLSVLALNYDLPATRENLKVLSSQYLDLMIVVAYDGYYVYENTGHYDRDEDSNRYDSISLPKLPFTYSQGNDLYSLDLGFEKALKLSPSGITEVDTPLSRVETLSIVNQLINAEINYRLSNRALKTVNIPVETTTVGSVSNNIENVSVIALINNVDFNTTSKLNAFSIGGAEVSQTRVVACYQRNGPKYCYVDLIPSSVTGGVDPNRWAEVLVTSIDEAAARGYLPDIEFLERSD